MIQRWMKSVDLYILDINQSTDLKLSIYLWKMLQAGFSICSLSEGDWLTSEVTSTSTSWCKTLDACGVSDIRHWTQSVTVESQESESNQLRSVQDSEMSSLNHYLIQVQMVKPFVNCLSHTVVLYTTAYINCMVCNYFGLQWMYANIHNTVCMVCNLFGLQCLSQLYGMQFGLQ